MSLNTYPYNPFPASTDKLDEAHNAELRRDIDQLKSGLNDLSSRPTFSRDIPNSGTWVTTDILTTNKMVNIVFDQGGEHYNLIFAPEYMGNESAATNLIKGEDLMYEAYTCISSEGYIKFYVGIHLSTITFSVKLF